MAGAQTGTGKTAAFALPILQRLAPHASTSASPARHPVRVLVLTPTRELAVQVVRELPRLRQAPAAAQHRGLRRRRHERADRAAAQGRRDPGGDAGPPARPRAEQDGDVQPGVGAGAGRSRPHARHGLPARHQAHHRAAAARSGRTCCSRPPSRTRSARWRRRCCATRPRCRSRRATPPPISVTHVVHPVAREKKRELLSYLIQTRGLKQVLVFCGTRIGANRLAHQLRRDHIHADAIHGDKTQAEREAALAGLQGRQDRGAGGDRRRLARPRHRRPAAGDQLRRAALARGLRAPHRPHRPRRPDRRGDLAGRAAGPRRDRRRSSG